MRLKYAKSSDGYDVLLVTGATSERVAHIQKGEWTCPAREVRWEIALAPFDKRGAALRTDKYTESMAEAKSWIEDKILGFVAQGIREREIFFAQKDKAR